jgi:predicted regulator of Ras-like GTPase activity (Roadblock/LC7/MglB family)
MFGFLKNLFSKPVANGELETSSPEAFSPAEPAPSHVPESPPVRTRLVRQNGSGVELPLEKILPTLPLELQPHVLQTSVDAITISVPLEKILAQLSHGTVKIPFGDLRQAAPSVFSAEADRDRVLVPLPLQEILARLNPVLLTRRRVQRHVQVPEEISSPFGNDGQGLIFSAGPSRPTANPSHAAPHRQMAPEPSSPAPPTHLPALPAAPVGPPTPFVNHNGRGSLQAAPTPPPPIAMPAAPPALATAPQPTRGLNGNGSHSPALKLPTPPPAEAHSEQDPLVLGLTTLAESWPEAVRKEILSLNLVDAKVALPAEMIERALKQGRLAFSWKTVRSWIRPAALPAVSAHDGLVLELPLKVVAPLFLARQREAGKDKQKVTVDEDIPNLFFGFPQPEPGTGKPTPNDTNYYVWDDGAEMLRVDASADKRGPSPGTKFVAKYATPNEVVSRAAAFEGVGGALIALPDGLMVANKLPAELNGDTLAAFLPQIFGKVSQCTKELRMGDLNNLNFTVGNVPWKIFRVNSIFFAAFGRAGQALPTAQLAALAAELDHKPK